MRIFGTILTTSCVDSDVDQDVEHDDDKDDKDDDYENDYCYYSTGIIIIIIRGFENARACLVSELRSQGHNRARAVGLL